jgi:hypothetical protein
VFNSLMCQQRTLLGADRRRSRSRALTVFFRYFKAVPEFRPGVHFDAYSQVAAAISVSNPVSLLTDQRVAGNTVELQRAIDLVSRAGPPAPAMPGKTATATKDGARICARGQRSQKTSGFHDLPAVRRAMMPTSNRSAKSPR